MYLLCVHSVSKTTNKRNSRTSRKNFLTSQIIKVFPVTSPLKITMKIFIQIFESGRGLLDDVGEKNNNKTMYK